MRAKQFLKLAKGFRGRAKNCTRIAANRVSKSLEKAYIGRKQKKRDFRRLWIQQVNAASREQGLPYSSLINGLMQTNIALDRKVLADLATTEPKSFRAVIEVVKDSASVRPLNDFFKIPKYTTMKQES